MTTIKRLGYPDISDEDLKPICEINFEPTTPNLQFKVSEYIGIGVINPRGISGAQKTIKTVIVGE